MIQKVLIYYLIHFFQQKVIHKCVHDKIKKPKIKTFEKHFDMLLS